MIKNKNELKKVLNVERTLYLGLIKSHRIKLRLLQDHDYLIWRFVKSLRYTEYHCNTHHKVRYWLWQRRKNVLGGMLGITMWHNSVDCGLRIYHYGSIIINGHAKIGKNCKFHGDNCIGNKGDFNLSVPIIGDNVTVGNGAKIIGDVHIANGIKIGANAVVTKSFYEEGIVIAGVPAKKIS